MSGETERSRADRAGAATRDAATSRCSSARSVEAEFRAFDRDGDGTIDFAEFKSLLTHLGLRRDMDLMQRLFRSMDHDGNGKIVLSEFSAWWGNRDDAS